MKPSADTRAHVHQLVDQLLPVQVAALETLLESMVDNDEELTAWDRAAIQAGLKSLEENRGIPMEDVLADFGLTIADFEKIADEN